MKLKKSQLVVVGFMLFSLFFGAGNLIFPPFLGNQAGKSMPVAFIGFIIPAVILPVLGVIIVAKFGGLDKLASRVHPIFAVVFTIIILLSIGPGLGIPRAASVPYELAISPYMNDNLSDFWFMLLYSFIFFVIALWLALTPSKLPNRIGRVLTPSLLVLIVVMFVTFMFKGDFNVAEPVKNYQTGVFLKGFCDGYQTMDTIAALNFGLVIANTLFSMGIDDNKTVVKYTVKTGIVAGVILTVIYLMLSLMGMATSSIYTKVNDGSEILRPIVEMLFGKFGAVFMITLFTLACLTTCVGLIASISKYFADLFKKTNYKMWAVVITIVSFLICNLGLDKILAISVPVLNAIYPVAIVLILLGLFDFLYKENKIIYPITIATTGIISIVYAIDCLVKPDSFFVIFDSWLPGYELGFGWAIFAAASVLLSVIIQLIINAVHKNKDKKTA